MKENKTKIEELEGQLESKLFWNLESFFKAAGVDFENLHEWLGIKKTKFTRLNNNPKKEGTLVICKEISLRTGVRASLLINCLGFGRDNITLDQMDNLVFEEKQALKKRA